MAHRETATQRGPLTRAPSGMLVVAAIASAQFGAALAATMFARIGPGGTVQLRLAFAALALVAVSRPRVRDLRRDQLALIGAFGLVLGAMNLSFYEAVHRIPLGIAVSIEFTGPLAIAVAGSRRVLDLLWVGLAAVGILALTRGGAQPVSGAGVGFALLAGACWAAYIVLNARVGASFERTTGLALAMCVGSVAVLPIGIADGGGRLLEPELLALGAVVGLLSSAIPYSLEMEALRRIPAGVFGVLMSLEPAMAVLAGLLVLGQRLDARALAGIVLVVLASVGASRGAREAPVAV